MLASIPGIQVAVHLALLSLTEVRFTFCVGSAFTMDVGVTYNRELPAIKSARLAHVILLRVFIKNSSSIKIV